MLNYWYNYDKFGHGRCDKRYQKQYVVSSIFMFLQISLSLIIIDLLI